jgi:hypothetical protein
LELPACVWFYPVSSSQRTRKGGPTQDEWIELTRCFHPYALAVRSLVPCRSTKVRKCFFLFDYDFVLSTRAHVHLPCVTQI